MRRSAILLGLVITACATSAAGVDLPLVQTGGFFASGVLNNSPTFQNYFVGYGTSPGLPRTDERRSFFVFDVPAFPSDTAITGAVLKLRLPFGGLIFGKGPGDPLAGPVPSDLTETFALGVVGVPSSVVLSPTLPVAAAVALFAAMDDVMVAAPTVFTGAGLPPPPDGGPPVVTIVLDGLGLGALEAARGSTVVLTGWMPSWSYDDRLSPTPPPLYFEASELIFGLTDVHVLAILTPVLTLTLSPVPEPPAPALWIAGLALLAAWRVGWHRRADLPPLPLT